MALPYTLEALLLGVNRGIFGKGTTIIPDVVVSEQHVDEVVVTTHPVGVGADIADHAYVMPATVNCTFGWSGSSTLVNSALSGSLLKGVKTVTDVYEKLRELMRSRQPLEVCTGKRRYANMLIVRLETTTTADTENALLITVGFQEVLTASARSAALFVPKDAKRHGGQSSRGAVALNPATIGG